MLHLAEIKATAMERGSQARARARSLRAERSSGRPAVRRLLAILAITLEIGAFVAWMRRRSHAAVETPAAA